MKAQRVLVLAALFFTASLPGFSQASWNQPESVKKLIFKSNSAGVIQLAQISAIMTTASFLSYINPDLAKVQAEKAKEMIAQSGPLSAKEIQQALTEMMNSIIAFLLQLQLVKVEPAKTIQRG